MNYDKLVCICPCAATTVPLSIESNGRIISRFGSNSAKYVCDVRGYGTDAEITKN